MDTDRATLLARRVPRDEVSPGSAYVIHARNGGVGVAVITRAGTLGYVLHRVKFDRHYLFTEIDWADDDMHGTAIPLRLLEARPPAHDRDLLQWLADREAEHREEIKAAWREVLSFPVPSPAG